MAKHFSIRNAEKAERFKEIAKKKRLLHGPLFDEMIDNYEKLN